MQQAANVLNLWGKLTKRQALKADSREDTMATKPSETENKSERAATRAQRAAARAEKREGRSKRESARKEKAADSGKPARLCSLATVEVRKTAEGFQVSVDGSGGRGSFKIGSGDVGAVLRDLETAIHVIRGQQ